MTLRLGSKKLLSASFGYKVEYGRSTRKDPFRLREQSNRWVLLVVLVILFAVVGLGRLADLQLVSGSYYRVLAEGNRIRRIPIKAARGEVLDRSGQPLARNIPIYKLATFTLSGVVEKTEVVSRELALQIQAAGAEEANRLLINTGREYPLGETTAHLLGYVNEASSVEIGKTVECDLGSGGNYRLQTQYQLEDLVGRMGVEQYYDCLLRGVNGEELIEVDARGRLVRRLGRREPVPGKTLRLAIDSQVQTVAYQALLDAPGENGFGPRREKGEIVRGAVIVIDPQGGEVMALVSLPSFDPSRINQNYAKYAKDEGLPFFNRIIGGAFHPGSVYKLITATAGIETGAISRDFTYRDEGFIELGGIKFRNWLYVRNGRTEGEINLARAITRSTDTFFYKAGEMIGIKALDDWSTVFGLGRKTGIDLPGEVTGLLPTPEWKEKAKGERWFLGNTYNMSIGQGDLTVTPVQIVAVTGVFANGGKLCAPRVAKDVTSITRLKLGEAKCAELGLKQESLAIVREGMVGACSPGGTAGQFFKFTPRVACKTGTAQFTTDITHAWFTAFAPIAGGSAEIKPEIAATVLVEGGGEGSVVAAPVVKKIFEKWFNK